LRRTTYYLTFRSQTDRLQIVPGIKGGLQRLSIGQGRILLEGFVIVDGLSPGVIAMPANEIVLVRVGFFCDAVIHDQHSNALIRGVNGPGPS
jgi:hypothetical protein